MSVWKFKYEHSFFAFKVFTLSWGQQTDNKAEGGKRYRNRTPWGCKRQKQLLVWGLKEGSLEQLSFLIVEPVRFWATETEGAGIAQAKNETPQKTKKNPKNKNPTMLESTQGKVGQCGYSKRCPRWWGKWVTRCRGCV